MIALQVSKIPGASSPGGFYPQPRGSQAHTCMSPQSSDCLTFIHNLKPSDPSIFFRTPHIVHINAFQANDIKSLSKYNNVETTDYQYTDDWVINHIPIFSSPGFIDGANYIIREPSGCQIESFLNIHFDPISKGFNFWNKLRSKQNNCLLKPCKNNY